MIDIKVSIVIKELLHLLVKPEGFKKIEDKKSYNTDDLEEKLRQAEERLKAQDAEIEMLKKFTAFLPSTSRKANKHAAIDHCINM